jgi:hypothetical protein
MIGSRFFLWAGMMFSLILYGFPRVFARGYGMVVRTPFCCFLYSSFAATSHGGLVPDGNGEN